MDDGAAGAGRRRAMQGPKTEKLMASVADLDRQLAGWVDEFVFGTVWARGGLADAERLLVAISALAALGRSEQLRTYLFGALHAGVDAAKIHEALVMLTVYAGFPAAIDALSVWRGVLASARGNGLTPDAGQGRM